MPSHTLRFYLFLTFEKNCTASGCLFVSCGWGNFARSGTGFATHCLCRTLNAFELHLRASEKEALACVWGVQKFYTFIEHQDYPKQVGKIGRWIAKPDNFRFKISHTQGKYNAIADCLSRMHDEDDDDIQIEHTSVEEGGKIC
ncbi:hypothetical protein PR048_016056 [Dryococelus australis]|uniref:Reverse transcriptase RNase H-like domain-containing protein n=1 Tax=Dryococelus australis TaxID=614101 RepID=A0ABQ9HJ19_9NEOP|nr:hypothetical protein PR048_016056 [Dryococelus australis]